MATTFSLVVIFVPVSFMSSISGRFLYQFGITAAVAVLVSLLVSFTLTPMMSARLFRSGSGRRPNPTPRRTGDENRVAIRARAAGFTRGLIAAYSKVLGWSMRHRWRSSPGSRCS